MRKFLISAALISIAATSAPAAAQYNAGRSAYAYNNARTGQAIDRQVQQLHQRIDQMYQRRLLSNNEVRKLHSEAEKVQRRHYDYARNGLSPNEHRDLMNRLQNLRQRIQRERVEGREQVQDARWEDRRERW
jgi:predicted amino acid racemase